MIRIRVAVAAAVLQMAVGLSYTWGALAPFALRQTHWPSFLVALVTSATPAFYGFGMLAGGRLGDLLPPRRLIWLGWGVLSASYLVTFLHPAPQTFVLFYAGLGQGFGGGLSMAASLAAFRQVFARSIGLAGGALVSWFVASALLLVPILTTLAPVLGWQAALGLVAAGISTAAFLALLLLPSLPSPRPHHETGRPPFWSLLLRPMVLTSFLVEVLATPLGSSAYVHVGPYVDGLGRGLAMAAAAAAMTVAGNSLGRLVGGAASDRAGVTPVLVAVLAASLACVPLLAAAPSTPLLLLAAFLSGLGFGVPNGVMPRLAAEVAPEAPNTGFGLIFAGFATGSFAGPLLGELAGNTARGWWLMAVFPAAALLVLATRSALYSRS